MSSHLRCYLVLVVWTSALSLLTNGCAPELSVRRPEPELGAAPATAQRESAREEVEKAEPAAELPAEASLDDYRRYALETNPRLEAHFRRWRAQLERPAQARALPEPRFTYGEFLREIETRTGPQERKFGLVQPIPWPWKLRLRGSMETELANVAWQRLLAAQLAVDQELRSVYADYYFLGKSIRIMRENLDLLRRLEGVARQKLAAGAGSHPDIVRLQVEIGRLEDGLKTLSDRQRPMRAKLNSILNRPAATEIPWPERLPGPQSYAEERALLAHAAENNPGLNELQHQIERASIGMRLARTEYFPDLSIGVETIETSSAIAPNTRGSGDDPWLMTFSLEIPLWYQKYRAGEREAREMWEAARGEHAQRKNTLIADLELALYNRRDSERRIVLFERTLLPKAEESLTVNEAAFRADAADFLDIIDAQRVLLQFQLARERALSDRLRAEAEIDRLLGRYVTTRSKETVPSEEREAER